MARILVIDDSEAVLAFTREALEEEGHTVFTARNGIEANKIIFSRNKPELILLDIMMPLLDGEKVAMAFQRSEISSEIPIVFFSTKKAEELNGIVKKHSVRGYIQKPISAEKLKIEVRNFLR